MRAYGQKKTNGPHIAGHQDCGICHPPQKNKKKRARREGKQEASYVGNNPTWAELRDRIDEYIESAGLTPEEVIVNWIDISDSKPWGWNGKVKLDKRPYGWSIDVY